MPQWLKDAVFYEIYPQSFQDTNGDGIGDFQGITGKLDYIRDLGCNALWINPCFDSPFKDAGYDVRDYKKVAPRYGTNEDLYHLFEEAHKRGIRVLLDLVPGHTSEEHEWFTMSQKAETNEYSNRYIWTNHCFEGAKGFPYIGGESERSGVYVLNFFKAGTCAIWRDVREMLDSDYPEAAMVSEWGNPRLALKAGFHMDFFLNGRGNGYSTLMRDYENQEDHSFFKKDSHGDITRFLDDYLPKYEASKEDGYFCLLTCNHDTLRPRYNLDETELKLAFAFIFTMPGVPYLYYGDEIGMRYLELTTKEGGYFRTGSRTPMQWNSGKNAGFSDADKDSLYLPVDEAPDAPTVENQESNPDSLLHTVKALLALRHDRADLQADAEFEPLYAKKGAMPFVYRRGALTIAVNPSGETVTVPSDGQKSAIYSIGSGSWANGQIVLEPQSFVVLEPNTP